LDRGVFGWPASCARARPLACPRRRRFLVRDVAPFPVTTA